MDKLPDILKKLVDTPIISHIDIIMSNYDDLTSREKRLLITLYISVISRLHARDRVNDHELIYLINNFNNDVEKTIIELKKYKN